MCICAYMFIYGYICLYSQYTAARQETQGDVANARMCNQSPKVVSAECECYTLQDQLLKQASCVCLCCPFRVYDAQTSL